MTQLPATIHLPAAASLMRQALRPLAESAVVPLGLFWILFTSAGFAAGIVGALCWSAVVIGVRVATRRPVPTVLVVSMVLMAARAAVGLSTGSAVLYFLQPTIQNLLFAGLLMVTIGANRPLLARLAEDFSVLPAGLIRHPQIARYFRQVSLLWAFVFLVNGTTTLVVLVTLSVNDYLTVSTAGSYSMVALGVGLSLWWLRRMLARHGSRVRMGAPA